MSFLSSLFRRKPPEAMRDVASLAAPFAVPAVQMRLVDIPSRSHVGGRPNLPQGVAWPTRDSIQLDFLARISLPELAKAAPFAWLPSSGALLFFYDIARQPWGFDPADRGRWAVLHVDDLEGTATVADPLPSADPKVPFRYAQFRSIQSLPSSERESIESLGLNDSESDELVRLSDEPFGDSPKHQIGGFPSPVQGDNMELEAQLVSHGLYCGDASGYSDPRAAELGPGAKEWRLLLQFDSDDDLGLMWGDAGTLYFWVQEGAASKGDFQDTWLVLQCS